MNIKGLSKAKILAALYNNSKPLGLGMLHSDPKQMTEKEAAELLENQTYFDYLKGRVMKIHLDSDELDTYLYNRDNGNDAAEKIISKEFDLALVS